MRTNSIKIDEVDKKGSSKITVNKGNKVMPLPTPFIDGGSSSKKD